MLYLKSFSRRTAIVVEVSTTRAEVIQSKVKSSSVSWPWGEGGWLWRWDVEQSLGFCLEYRGAHFRGQTTREGNKRRGRFTLCTVAASMWKALLSTSLPAWLSAVIFSEACISLTRKCDQKFTPLNFVLSGFFSTWGVALFSVFWVTSDAEVESMFDGTLYDTYLISASI